jgi:hypothetical protein
LQPSTFSNISATPTVEGERETFSSFINKNQLVGTPPESAYFTIQTGLLRHIGFADPRTIVATEMHP